MSDVKEVITILCKCLHNTIDSPLTPEHFRRAKYDEKDAEVISAFWTTLDILSFYVLRELNTEIIIPNIDKVSKTKLRMAYLQYPALQFYSLSETANKSGGRTLLIALAWLITKYDVLKNVVRLKLINGPFGREFSRVDVEIKEKSCDANLSTIENQVNNLLHKSQKLSFNLKAISELQTEKIKLATRVHAASLTTSGLPHLTVAEMSLAKKLVTSSGTDNKNDLKQLKEIEKHASMLDDYTKWTNKSHTFYTWMKTVLDEWENKDDNDEEIAELSKFIYLLKTMINKRLKSFKKKNDNLLTIPLPSCPSRLLRSQKGPTEVQMYLDGKKSLLKDVDRHLEKRKADLESELEEIFKLLPDCHQI